MRRFSSTVIPSKSSRLWKERPSPSTALAADQAVTSAPSSRDSSGKRLGEAGERVDQRRLARAVRPDQPEHLARSDRERHVVHRVDHAETHPHSIGGERLRRDHRSPLRRALRPRRRPNDRRRRRSMLARPFGSHSSTTTTTTPSASWTTWLVVEDVTEDIRHHRPGGERGTEERTGRRTRCRR